MWLLTLSLLPASVNEFAARGTNTNHEAKIRILGNLTVCGSPRREFEGHEFAREDLPLVGLIRPQAIRQTSMS